MKEITECIDNTDAKADQQGHKVKCVHSYFHQHFIKEGPQRGGEISEIIFDSKKFLAN
jgi:hypothetical protein